MGETRTDEIDADSAAFAYTESDFEKESAVLREADQVLAEIWDHSKGDVVAAYISSGMYLSLGARHNFGVVEVGLHLAPPDAEIMGRSYSKPFVGILEVIASQREKDEDEMAPVISTLQENIQINLATIGREEWPEGDAESLFAHTDQILEQGSAEAYEYLVEQSVDVPGSAFRKLNKACRLGGEALFFEASAPFQAKGEHLPIEYFSPVLMRPFLDMDYFKHAHNLLRTQGQRNIGKWLRWMVDECHYWEQQLD